MRKFCSRVRISIILLGAFCGCNLAAEDREPTIQERNGEIFSLKQYRIVKKRRGEHREQLYLCKECGQVFDEKDLRSHSDYYGHYDFAPYGY